MKVYIIVDSDLKILSHEGSFKIYDTFKNACDKAQALMDKEPGTIYSVILTKIDTEGLKI